MTPPWSQWHHREANDTTVKPMTPPWSRWHHREANDTTVKPMTPPHVKPMTPPWSRWHHREAYDTTVKPMTPPWSRWHHREADDTTVKPMTPPWSRWHHLTWSRWHHLTWSRWSSAYFGIKHVIERLLHITRYATFVRELILRVASFTENAYATTCCGLSALLGIERFKRIPYINTENLTGRK